jgi:hypothetical protein
VSALARAPGRVLLAQPKTTILTRQEDGLAREVRGAVPGVRSRNGMPEAPGYVYRGTGADTLTAGLSDWRLRHEAKAAVPAPPAGFPKLPRVPPVRRPPVTASPPEPERAPVPVPVPPVPAAGEPAPKPRKPVKRAVLTTACPGCGRPKPDKYVTCGGTGPCLAPRPAPEPEPEPKLVAPGPESAPVPAKRHRKCGYPLGSVGHSTVCGGAS